MNPGARSFTLIEAVVSITVVGVMLVAALETVRATAQGRAVQADTRERETLANRLMMEILQLPYAEPMWETLTFQRGGTTYTSSEPLPWNAPSFGRESDELDGTRVGFDDVDDYDGWTESPPKSRDGTPLPDKTGWQWSVSVTYVDLATLTPSGGVDTGIKRITVTVTDDRGAQSSLVAMRTKLGPQDQPAAATRTDVTWVGVDLQLGSDQTHTVSTGAALFNRPAGTP